MAILSLSYLYINQRSSSIIQRRYNNVTIADNLYLVTVKEVSGNTSEIDPICMRNNGLYIIVNNVIYRLFIIINNNPISLKVKKHTKLMADPR